MDPTVRFWLNGAQAISTKRILTQAEKHPVADGRKNERGETARRIGASSFSASPSDKRRQNSLQAVEALFITQGRDPNQYESGGHR